MQEFLRLQSTPISGFSKKFFKVVSGPFIGSHVGSPVPMTSSDFFHNLLLLMTETTPASKNKLTPYTGEAVEWDALLERVVNFLEFLGVNHPKTAKQLEVELPANFKKNL
jgi:hypothetical protein